MSTELRSNLLRLLKDKSFKKGSFTLASGKHSDFYIDVKNTALHPEGADCIGQCVWSVLSVKDFEGVGGPTLGADPLATAVSLAAYRLGHILPAFIVRKEPKKHGTSQWMEGSENLKAGANLLVLEDVVTTGGSSLKAIEKIRAEGYAVDTLVCVLDRNEGGREALEKSGVRLVSLCTIEELKKVAL